MQKCIMELLKHPRKAAQFERRVVRSADPNECWKWTGALWQGYGTLGGGSAGTHVYAHRISYAIANGPFDESKCVLHKCDNPECTNPKHLFLGTKADNNKDRKNKGRNGKFNTAPERIARGERMGSAVLTDKDVNLIRILRRSGVSGPVLAKRFKVASSTIYAVVNRERWTHI